MTESKLKFDKKVIADVVDSQKDRVRNNDDWTGVWEKTDTPPWHLSDVNEGLIQHHNRMVNGKDNANVFVPLCGKSLDLFWLYEKGHTVIGVELSDIAIKDFFATHSIPFTKQIKHGVEVYEAENNKIKIFKTDVLTFSREFLDGIEIDAVYDRGSFVAMSPCNRPKYVEMLANLMPSNSCNLFERILYADDTKGPPFCFTDEGLEQLCGGYFTMEYVGNRVDEERHKEWLLRYLILTRK